MESARGKGPVTGRRIWACRVRWGLRKWMAPNGKEEFHASGCMGTGRGDALQSVNMMMLFLTSVCVFIHVCQNELAAMTG
jgi:hypothetical protein